MLSGRFFPLRPAFVVALLLLSTAATAALGQKADYRYKVLSDDSFNGQDLTGADFSYSVISDACFDKATLRNAKLKYTVASDAKFREADLRGALLRYSVMGSARFTGADCRGTDFTYCILTDADFSDADLRGAVFSSAILGGRFSAKTLYDERTKFPRDFDPVARGLTRREISKEEREEK
jgi:uncharacterized protein YjbI with pentapeptide repeats